MDGGGYPDGLEGEEIPLAARVLQIADIYDALTSNRPYRSALSAREAIRTLHAEAEEGWRDESLVDALEALNLSSDLQEEHGAVSGPVLRMEPRPGFPFGTRPQFALYSSGFVS